MKRIGQLLLCTMLVPLLGACGKSSSPQMYIESAQLTEQEQNIADLLGANQFSQLYDFSLDDTVASLQINTYELIDGQWQICLVGGSGQTFQDAKGRIALSFDKIPYGLRVGLQSQNHGGSSTYLSQNRQDMIGMSSTISWMTGRKEVVYEQEIPLAIQIFTSKSSIRSCTLDSFFHPEEYAQYGYEHVYALTVAFSQKVPA